MKLFIRFFYCIIIVALLIPSNVLAQSIGVNTDGSAPNSSAILDVKSTTKGFLSPRMTLTQRNAIKSPATGLLIFQTDNTVGYYYYNGSAWTPVTSSAGANYWSVNSFGDIYNNTLGFVGIGTSTPAYKFSVQTQTGQVGLSHTDGTVTLASYIGVFNGGLGGWLGTRSNHPLYFFTNNSAQQMTLLPSGNVGIGTINPTNKLQIGNNPGFSGYDIGIGNGTQGMVFQQNNGFSNWQSNTNITMLPTNATGNVGINTVSPTNHLQIGDNPGFSGYDLAISNGTQGMVFQQNTGFSNWQSNTNITLLPTNATGNVGINTTTPRFPLEVAGYVVKYTSYYDYFNKTTYINGIQRCAPCDATVSIFASNAVYASEFDVFSDARIKNIIGNSNSIKDLKTINALQIKDYTMKDKVKYGNKLYKKVIAQEVEKVYPQVISKHTDFIPNVYQVTNKITKTDNGYLLTFLTNHKIDRNAKKLQLILAESGVQQFDIVAIPSATEVIINATDLKSDKVFVYGEEVDDFRTVDYEGLTTLNISATQELSKQLQKQQQEITLLVKEIRLLKQPSNKLTNAKHLIETKKIKKSES